MKIAAPIAENTVIRKETGGLVSLFNSLFLCDASHGDKRRARVAKMNAR